MPTIYIFVKLITNLSLQIKNITGKVQFIMLCSDITIVYFYYDNNFYIVDIRYSCNLPTLFFGAIQNTTWLETQMYSFLND